MPTEIVRDTTRVENTTPIPVVIEQVVQGEVVIMPAGTVVPVVDKSTVISITGGTKGEPGAPGPPGADGAVGPVGPPGAAGPANLTVSATEPTGVSSGHVWVDTSVEPNRIYRKL